MAIYDVSTTEKKASPELVAGGILYADSPIGTILPYGGVSAPSGWFLCQGQAISRTTYSELFAIIGTRFGSGDGSTTFNLPDMREAVPKGAGLTGHTVGAHLDADGLAVGEFLDDRLQQITLNVTNGNGGQGDRLSMGGGTILNTPLASTSTGFRYGVTTEVKSVGVNYIIKAKMTAVPSDFLAKVDEAVVEAMSPTVIAPSVHDNRYTIKGGGYYKIGKLVIVNISVTQLIAGITANDTMLAFDNMPTPTVGSVLSAESLGIANNICAMVYTDGSLRIINRSSANVNLQNKDIQITGTYMAIN